MTSAPAKQVPHGLPPIQELFRASLKRFLKHWPALALVSAAVSLVTLVVIAIAAFLTVGGSVAPFLASGSLPPADLIASAGTGLLLVVLVSLAIGFVGNAVSIGGMVHAALSEKKVTAVKALSYGWKHALPLVWIVALASAIQSAGWLLFIIPGLYLSIAFLFQIQVFEREGYRGLAALLRSRDLVRGRWWPVFGRILLAGVAVMLPDWLIQYGASVSEREGTGMILTQAYWLLAAYPFLVVVMTELYLQVSHGAQKKAPDVGTNAKVKWAIFTAVGLLVPLLAAGYAVVAFLASIQASL